MFSLKSIILIRSSAQINKGIRSFPFSKQYSNKKWKSKAKVKSSIAVEWKRPEIGWTKLNFDGSSKSSSSSSSEIGNASIGGVLRDHEARFLLGYAESIGRANSNIAELIALRKGLELVLENGWKNKVWFEGDAKAVVETIVENRKVKCEEAQTHIRYINSLMLEFDDCIFTHIYREGNRVANMFASIGHQFKELQIWREVPTSSFDILEIMRQDAEGKIVFRKRSSR